MVNLSVTKDANGESGAVTLPVDDILFMRHSSRLRRVVVCTAEETYYTTGPLSYWCTTLNNSGFAFSDADRTVAINLRKVIRLNDLFKTAYFDLNSKEGVMLSKKGYEALRGQLESLGIPFVNVMNRKQRFFFIFKNNVEL